MLNLKKNYKTLKRAKNIVTVLAKYGLGYFLDFAGLKKYLNFKKGFLDTKQKTENKQRLTLPQRARLACEELGPTFVKLGQILSVRPDLIPREFIKEFSKLQDEVPPFSFLLVKEQLEKEFGKDLEEIFIEFDKDPVAAASLSQVHKGKLKNGEVVAVKIQRPGIKKTINTDLDILFDLAAFVEKKSINGYILQPKKIAEEFAKNIKQELDFMAEGRNIDRFRTNFKDVPEVKIPKVYWDLTTSKILTMEYIEGVKVAVAAQAKSEKYDKKLIAIRGANMMLRQIFIDGFFHADPHPGNIFIIEDNIIALLDFGMVGQVDEETMADMADMLLGAIGNDVDKIIRSLDEMDIIDQTMDLRSLKAEIGYFISKYYGAPLKQLNIGIIAEEIIEIMIRHQIKIPHDLSLLVKALTTIEGVGRDLDPDFDMVAHIKPFAKKLMRKKYSANSLWKKGSKVLKDAFDFFEIFPRDFLWLMNSLKKGQLNVGFQHRGLEKLIKEINNASNRLSFSMIIAALIVGSSLILTQKIGPYIFGYPAVGIIGYLLASFFGLFLIISILRSGRWK